MSQQKTKLLLINPKFPESFWSFSWIFEKVIPTQRTSVPPLGLATLAALTPQDWEIRIIDENVEPIDWDSDADIVGVCGMSVQYQRQIEILAEFDRRGKFIVAGGSFASLCPEKYTHLCRSVLSGEAEYIWPKFCRDYLASEPKGLYKENGDVALTDSPLPRHDLIKWKYYLAGTIQFSRGCPYRCEFCDIIVTFGRKPRTKNLAQIEAELDSLRENSVRNIVFVDDNLVGNLPRSKELLEFLIEYQQRHCYTFSFGTEATVNITRKPEFLKLLRRANFAWIFVGIESPDVDSLAETKKTQNLQQDLAQSVFSFYQHGIDIFAGFIVGFDNDETDIFDKQYEFIVRSGIIIAMVGQLYAPPKTPLHERLLKDNRLKNDVEEEATLINAGAATNIIPLKMTSEELQHGCWNLHKRLLEDEAIYQRIRNKMRHLNHPGGYYFPAKYWGRIVYGLLRHGIVPGGASRWKYFGLSLLQTFRKPSQCHKLLWTVVADWSNALPLKMYADQILVEQNCEQSSRRLESLSRSLLAGKFRFVEETTLIGEETQQILQLSLNGNHINHRQARQFVSTLRKTTTSRDPIRIRIRQTENIDALRTFIGKLAPVRHQVQFELNDKLYAEISQEIRLFSYNLEHGTQLAPTAINALTPLH